MNKLSFLCALLFCSSLLGAEDPITPFIPDEEVWKKEVAAYPMGFPRSGSFKEEKEKIEKILGHPIKYDKVLYDLLGIGESLKILLNAPTDLGTYTAKAGRFFGNQITGLRHDIQGNPSLDGSGEEGLPHSVKDINKANLKRAYETLENPSLASDEHICEAKKTILFSRVPWRLLELLTSYNLERRIPDEDFKHLDRLPTYPLIKAWCNHGLKKDFEQLLKYRNDLVRVYTDHTLVPVESLMNAGPLWEDMPTLTVMGRFYRDQIYLRYLSQNWDLLGQLNQANVLKHKKGRFALLKLITAMGEVSKCLSPNLVNTLNKDTWRLTAKIRDAFHTSRGYKRFFDLVHKENRKFFYLFLPELRKIGEELFSNLAPIVHYEDIIDYYEKMQKEQSETHSASIERLHDYLLATVSVYEKERLLKTLETRRTTCELEVESIKNAVKLKDKDALEEKLEAFPALTKNKKKAIREVLKKHKKGTELNEAEIEKIEKKLEGMELPSEEEAQKKVREIIKNLAEYNFKDQSSQKVGDWDRLERDLKKLGIQELEPWENALDDAISLPRGSTTLSKSLSVLNNILLSIEDMKDVMAENMALPFKDRLIHYTENPVLESASIFLLGCFRQEAELLRGVLEDLALHYIFPEPKLEELFETTAGYMDWLIQQGKGIFHLHEAYGEGERWTNLMNRFFLAFWCVGVNIESVESGQHPSVDSYADDLHKLISILNPYAEGQKSYQKYVYANIHSGAGAQGFSTVIQFRPVVVPGDNDCGFHVFGITREEAKKKLLDHSYDPYIRNLVANEIKETMRENQLPGEVGALPGLQDLIKKRHDLERDIDEKARYYRERTGLAGSREELIKIEVEEEFQTEKQELTALVEELFQSEKDLDVFFQKEDTYIKFIENYVGQEGSWLTYIKGSSSSMDALADLLKQHIKIIRYNPTTHKHEVVHTYSPREAENILYFHHNGDGTHFDKLEPMVPRDKFAVHHRPLIVV